MKNFLDEQLMKSRTVAITGHTRPDGDCAGSCMGLYNYIVENYPELETDVYLESFAECYKVISRTDEIKKPGDADKVYDLFICLDTSQKERMTENAEKYFDQAKTRINIDHHVSNTGFADIDHVVPDASSSCEVLYDLLDDEKISLAAAEALYIGIICDSGVFKYSSTGEHTMQVSGKLMSKGINTARLIDGVFYEHTYVQARLLGQALLNSQLVLGGRCIYTVVDREMFARFGAGRDDLEGIVEQLRLTKGVEVAILISENENGAVKFSFRSKDIVDVNKVASIYNGGGHIRAAGCTVYEKYEEPLKKFLENIEGQLAANV